MQDYPTTPLVSETLPDLASELEDLFARGGHVELAAQVPGLRIVDRCKCGDDLCATFYTRPRPNGKYGFNHRTVELNPAKGMLIIDLVDEQIACVEVLFRDEVRQLLHKAVP